MFEKYLKCLKNIFKMFENNLRNCLKNIEKSLKNSRNDKLKTIETLKMEKQEEMVKFG